MGKVENTIGLFNIVKSKHQEMMHLYFKYFELIDKFSKYMDMKSIDYWDSIYYEANKKDVELYHRAHYAFSIDFDTITESDENEFITNADEMVKSFKNKIGDMEIYLKNQMLMHIPDGIIEKLDLIKSIHFRTVEFNRNRDINECEYILSHIDALTNTGFQIIINDEYCILEPKEEIYEIIKEELDRRESV